MPSLPTVGGDINSWGTELNDFLLQGHNSDGSNRYIAPITLSFGSSITPADGGGPQIIDASSGIAFTINAVVTPVAGQVMIFDIRNNSGGALGTITWNAVFKLAGVFTNPANTKRRTITFY